MTHPQELSIAAFLAGLDPLNAVYAAAMRPDPVLLPGRREIMERHTRHPGFRALAIVCRPAGDSRTGDDQLIAFTYGFLGASGQWWHDVVRSAVTARAGETLAAAWLESSLEVAELHVHPDFQRRGFGRSLLLGLTAGRREHTAVLSTQDSNMPARHLYRGLGFADLLTGFSFPGGGPTYTVMGAALPLRVIPQPASGPAGGRWRDPPRSSRL
jgi:ribosomal protein S18 acetylase RimI-like enzyme